MAEKFNFKNILFDLNGFQLDPSDDFDVIEVYSQKKNSV